jgi:hypothetical protein
MVYGADPSAELELGGTIRSNAAFHYLGSARICSRVGEASAEAIVNMKRNGK